MSLSWNKWITYCRRSLANYSIPCSRRLASQRKVTDAFPVCIKQISKGRTRPTTLKGVRLSFVVYAVAYGDLLGFARIHSRFQAPRCSYREAAIESNHGRPRKPLKLFGPNTAGTGVLSVRQGTPFEQ